MSEPKWMRGPWKTDAEFEHEVVLGGDGVMVADCCIGSPKRAKKGLCAANARLIAAAPDLAEAGSDALKFLNSIEGAGYGGIAEFEIVREALRAALAKAGAR